MIIIDAMIRNLCLIMATNCIFLNFINSGNIYLYVKCVKTACLQKESRTENVKMLLQDNSINNGVTNGLKWKKGKKLAKKIYMVK